MVMAPYISPRTLNKIARYDISELVHTDMNKLTAGVYLQGMVFLSPLTLALAYTFAQENPRRMTGFYILTFEARFLPWVLLFITFILSGPSAAMSQFTGLLAAHMYEFLTRIWPEL